MRILNKLMRQGGGVLAFCIVVAMALALATRSTGATSPAMIRAEDAPWMLGVNLAVGEFNASGFELGTDYGYPATEEIDHFVERGMTVFRIPFLAQRIMQPMLAGEARLREEMDLLVALIEHAATRKAYVILDMHDYGSIFTAGLIGRSPGSVEEFAEAWRMIAERVSEHSNVIFGLMNEPNQQSAREWLMGANAAIAAIRETGAEQLILVPGSYWSGAHSWTGTDNAVVMLDIIDPLDNFAYEVHQYLDENSSGTSPDVVEGAGSTRLAGFTDWARQHEVRGFLGEFGWADTPEAQAEGEALMRHMSENRDVWIGGTYWAAGPWWGDYMFSVAPTEDGDRPQMDVLKQFVK
jgi:endoglucanase